MSKEAMKLALDHLINLQPILGNGLLEERQLAFIDPHIDCAITALQNGLAEQPAQKEPVKFWCETCEGGGKVYQEHQAGCHVGGEFDCPDCDGHGFFTSPPAQRKPLTPEWIWIWLMDWCKRNGTSPANYDSLFRMVSDARAIEAAHGIGVEK